MTGYKTTSFISLGSQIGNPTVRNTFGGRLVMPHVGKWFHLYNPKDHVLTAPVKLFGHAGEFTQVVTEFDKPNDILNHDAVFYIQNPQTVTVWKSLSGKTPASRTIAAAPQQLLPEHNEKALARGIDQYADSGHNLEGCVNDAFCQCGTSGNGIQSREYPFALE